MIDPQITNQNIQPFQNVFLKKEYEYRIQVDQNDSIEVKLITGSAEIFGQQLSKQVKYKYEGGTKLAIFTWHGCNLQITQASGKLDCGYDQGFEEENINPMIKYINLHYILEQERKRAVKNLTFGPKVIILGSAYSGKMSLCKILANYAMKSGWNPIYCDLDIHTNTICTSGTIGAVVMNDFFPKDFLDNYNKIVFFHGYQQYSQKNFYLQQIKKLGNVVQNKLLENLNILKKNLSQHPMYQDNEIFNELVLSEVQTMFASGIIIRAPSWSEQLGFDTYKEIVDSFQADNIIVLDEDGLFKKMQTQFPNKNVIKFQKSGGVIQVNESAKNKLTDLRYQKYFVGIPNEIQVKSSKHIISYNSMKIIQITRNPASKSTLPANLKQEDLDVIRIIKIEPWETNLSKRVLGIVHLKYFETDQNDDRLLDKLLNSTLMSTIYIEKVNHEEKMMEILFPSQQFDENILKNYILYSEITWMR